MKDRESFSSFVDKSFWAMLLGSVGFGVHFLSELSTQIRELNEKVAVVLDRSENETNTVLDHEIRLQAIEAKLMIHRSPDAIPNHGPAALRKLHSSGALDSDKSP